MADLALSLEMGFMKIVMSSKQAPDLSIHKEAHLNWGDQRQSNTIVVQRQGEESATARHFLLTLETRC